LGQTVLVPVLAMFTAFVAGSVLIVLTDFTVLDALRGIAGPEVSLLGAMWNAISVAYGAMFQGAIGDFGQIAAALGSGDARAIGTALYPLSESLVTATPYILAGLAVAVGFRCGLFNIGVEGQLYLGAVFGTFVGYSLTGLPALIHVPLAMIAGALGGALWAAIPAVLKARVGAHEVITTIMLNYIALRLVTWLLSGPMQRSGSTNPISPFVAASAELPRLLPDPARFHIGFFIALLVAFGIWYLLFRTTVGFEIRTVGANGDAAKYAGMSVTRNLVLAMCLSGGLAGLAGAIEVLGVNRTLTTGLSSGIGFDSIALALLGQSHPAGVVGAALLFGTLRAGATSMQAQAQIPVDIISVIQALVIAFIAAPAIIRGLYRIRQSGEGVQTVFMRGWGK
jgi:simple sugar transport system permease protein